jgi:hypothetical protein
LSSSHLEEVVDVDDKGLFVQGIQDEVLPIQLE